MLGAFFMIKCQQKRLPEGSLSSFIKSEQLLESVVQD